MLRSRIIPCLLVHKNGLVKTVRFNDKTYIGDPINTVKIFNEKEVDELLVLDIDATVIGREPNYNLIEKLANESRMPLCYGGGIKTPQQATRIFNLGVEKIALSSIAIKEPDIVSDLVDMVGSQSVVAVIDVKKNFFGKYEIVTHNGTKSAGVDLYKTINSLIERGVGELVINSVDNDGVMSGYDFKLIDKIYESIKVPLTILGGAGSIDDVLEAVRRYKIIGVSAGSIFVFKGKYKAVLISYPEDLL
jgi:cyclase